ncbi:HIT-like domain-containing protein [Dichomitus squalens]|uniref:HIT-like domain-containing protein n=1 Tax=Dichomitus squalens TaxID=114155 RepID=A0A4Q9QEV0_9APHY|nr:HIT-like domain-containing protein [Dichomitus squalens]
MAHLTILRTYAERVDPNTLPPTVKLCHSDFSVTIFDKYPKAYFHFILIPFIRPPLTAANLKDIRSLLQLPREQAKGLLRNIRRDALEAKALIEEEMVKQRGFKWGIQMGFHAVPSLEHIHLHIMSTEFRGEYMRSKKHLNSFHPTVGFFIHLDDVLSWFDPGVEPTWFAMKSDIVKKEYEKLLKEDMTCPGHCDKPFKTMPKLREHLREVFDSAAKASKAAKEAAASADVPVNGALEVNSTQTDDAEFVVGTKRKHGDALDATSSQDADPPLSDAPHPAKKQATGSPSEDLPQDL